MKIPTYTAPIGGATTEAPGRRMNVRMNAQPFVQAALQQGQVVAEVANQVGEYAATRYKIITENNLNEALLGAEETLRTRAYELANSNDYSKALDGDDPIWNREVEEIKGSLRDRIGGNVYALQQFDARFGQLELTQRFALRGVVDRKIEAAARAGREQNLRRFADTVATGEDLAAVDLAARTIGIDSERWAVVGAGNYEALTRQETAALKDGAFRAVQRLVDNSRTPERVLDNIRVAIREDDPTKAGAEGLYAYGVLQRLPYSDRQAILSSLGTDVAFFNAPTEEEKAAARAAELAGNAAGDQAAALMDQLSSGIPVPPEALGLPRQQLEAAAPAMTAADFTTAARKVEDLEFVNSVAQTLNRVSNPETLRSQINTIKNSGLANEGVSGVDTDRERTLLAFMEKYETNMRSAIENGGLLEWARNTGAVPVGNVDMSVSSILENQTGLANRASQRLAVSAHYGQPLSSIPVFDKQEAASLVEQIRGLDLEPALAVVGSMQAELGEAAPRAIEDLRAAGLPAEYTEMMYQTNPIVQRELMQVSGVTLTELKQGIESTVSVDVDRELSATLSDYRAAFVAGGDQSADRIFNEQYAIAEKLALFRIRRTGESPAAAAESVIKDLFPPQSNWLNSAQLSVIVPKNYDGNIVEAALGNLLDENEIARFNLVPLDNPVLPEYADLAVSTKSLASTGIWLNNSTGDGAVLHYNIGGTYIPAFVNPNNTEPRPFEILFEEAPLLRAATQERSMPSWMQGYSDMGADMATGVSP